MHCNTNLRKHIFKSIPYAPWNFNIGPEKFEMPTGKESFKNNPFSWATLDKLPGFSPFPTLEAPPKIPILRSSTPKKKPPWQLRALSHLHTWQGENVDGWFVGMDGFFSMGEPGVWFYLLGMKSTPWYLFFLFRLYICWGFLHHMLGIIVTNMSFWIFPVFSDERWNKDIFLKCTVLWRLWSTHLFEYNSHSLCRSFRPLIFWHVAQCWMKIYWPTALANV